MPNSLQYHVDTNWRSKVCNDLDQDRESENGVFVTLKSIGEDNAAFAQGADSRYVRIRPKKR